MAGVVQLDLGVRVGVGVVDARLGPEVADVGSLE